MNPENHLALEISSNLRHCRLKVGEHDLSYVEAGSGEPLFLIHGLNMGWGQWYANLDFLARNRKVVALDLPGSGSSSRLSSESGDFGEQLVKAVEGFMEQQGWRNVDVIGHSLGAWVALKIASKDGNRMRRIMAVSPLGFGKETPPKYRPLGFRWLARALSKTVMRPNLANMGNFTSSVFKDPDSLSAAFVRYYRDSLAAGGHEHPFLWINRFAGPRKMREQFVLSDAEKDSIQVPVSILIGDKDPILSSRERPQDIFKLPFSKLSLVQGSGHVPPTEQPEAFHAAVIQFLS